jgi:hypothetical protein
MWNFGTLLKSLIPVFQTEIIYLNPDGTVLTPATGQDPTGSSASPRTYSEHYTLLVDSTSEEKISLEKILQEAAMKGSVKKQLGLKHTTGEIKKFPLKIDAIKDDFGEVLGFIVRQPKIDRR